MGEAIDIARAEDKTGAELQGIRAQFVLLVAGGASAITAFKIVAAKKVQQISGAQIGDAIGFALIVDQQRKADAGFLAENEGIVAVTKTDRCKGRALAPEGLLVFAQLRDMLAAEDSPVVTQKNDDGGAVLPQRAQPDFPSVGVRKDDVRELLAESFLHGRPSLKSGPRSVKGARQWHGEPFANGVH